ncbi:uncharacterized protein [Eurosta solidaginis]|uniref:uncharacterized protein isoform X2 n=1 Tax=Eurosta solidaginis TaxID=178769 RepID=UPI0035309C59
MAENHNLQRLEDQLYRYRPELKRDSEDVKSERRKRLCLQLHKGYPVVQLSKLDAVSSLVDIKNRLEKCKDSILDPIDDCREMVLASPSTSLFESSGDEFQISQRPRRAPRKRKSVSSFLYADFIESRKEHKDDAPLSVSILIPQVVQCSGDMEISIDLGGVNASQRMYNSRLTGLVHNRSLSGSSVIEDLPIEDKPSTSSKIEHLQMTSTSSSIQTTDYSDKQDEEVLSSLISQVLVENTDTETLQATDVLNNINNNESSNYDAAVATPIAPLKVSKKRKATQRKPKKEKSENGPHKRRGRKPKSKANNQDGILENVGLHKSELAKYVELFSNTCNLVGSATPAASSTMSQQMVTSTTHYLDSNEQQPITYFLEGDWQNGGNCQLVQTGSVPMDGAQEEFNMTELVNYIDNVGDDGNVIARVLDGSNALPILIQDSNSQSNATAPPPAHVSNVLLDLSKKSTTTVTPSASEINHNLDEVSNNEILPLDLSLKSSRFNVTPVTFNADLTASLRVEAASEEVFVNNDYRSFEAALDMPLIDIEDNINAFMELTNNEVIPPENSTATGTTLTSICDANANENANFHLPISDFELSGTLPKSDVCNTESGKIFINENNGNNVNSTDASAHASDPIKYIINTTVNKDDSNTGIRTCSLVEKSISTVNTEHETNSTTTLEDIKPFSPNIHTSKENADLNEVGHPGEIMKDSEHSEISKCVENGKINSELNNATIENYTNSELQDATVENDTNLNHIVDCKIVGQSNTGAAFTQNITDTTHSKISEQNDCLLKDDISKKIPKQMDIEGSVDNNEELHGNLSEKSSIDFLFVDTDSLPGNILKNSYGEAITDCSNKFLTKTEPDESSYVAGEQTSTTDNDEIACDLSTKNYHSTSIDLEEDCLGHNVSMPLPMPQLPLMENSSEEFNYDYDIGFESAEERDLLSVPTEILDNDKTQCKDLGDQLFKIGGNCTPSKITTEMPVVKIEDHMSDSNDTNQRLGDNIFDETELITSSEKKNIPEDEGKENTTFEDSAVFCSQKYVDASMENESGKQDLQKNNSDQYENLDITEDSKFHLHMQTEKCTQELMHHNSVKANNVVVPKEENIVTSLSVLEMESKLDDACLDFEDGLEDDALSLATSYFNSSDDERLPEHKNSSIETLSDNVSTEKDDVKALTQDNILSAENSRILTCSSSNVSKMPTTRETSRFSGEILKKFKIPKLSMTTATVKHSNHTGSVAAAAPLPMVILPPNAFQKQSIKTEPDTNRPVGFEKITRTVQNVCAVPPLTLQHSTYASQSAVATTSSSSLDVVTPLIREKLQLTPPIGGENLNDFTLNAGVNIATSLNSHQIKYPRGETAGNGGDGRSFGPPAIVVAKTFGVTCLPFLVGKCFTHASCQFSHSFRDVDAVRNMLSTLSEVDLNVAYKFAYNHEIVFSQYMRQFCKIYIDRNNRFKLLNMVRDCERYNGGGELLVIIFHCLIQCGLNKVNACRQILNYSRDRSRPTIDALLHIILEADWTMFCDYVEKFSDVSSYHFRLNVLHQMAPTILRANDQRMTTVFFKCLVNLDPQDVGLVQTSPNLMQLLEVIKSGQTCR